MPHYEIIDHTADIGIRAFGKDLKKLFSTTAFGMFEILVDLNLVSENITKSVVVEAEDLEQLLVKWLSELLYLYETKGIIFKRFEIKKITPQRLESNVFGENINPSKHQIKTEIKNVTYHQLRVERTKDGWLAEVIFDL
ncbi:MAG: archease [Candidatus Edwardsbacteria bacterium]